MLCGIEVLCHSSIRIEKDKIIYVDPFKIEKEYNDADIIFCTHSHYDHFSEEDIRKVIKNDTILVITQDCLQKARNLGINKKNIIVVVPNQKYTILGIEVETVPAYNLEKDFHKPENNWVGYILEINDITYYIAGDTDLIPEIKSVNCDVAFLPIGGTYTMNAKEAAELANIIEPHIVIPIHYGTIVGTKKDEEKFVSKVKEDIECVVMIKNLK